MGIFRSATIVLALVLAPVVALAGPLGQAADDRPAFEVASVKINKSGERRGSMDLQAPGRLSVTNQTLQTLISSAYRAGWNGRRFSRPCRNSSV